MQVLKNLQLRKNNSLLLKDNGSNSNEIIIVRSLTSSDLGLFGVLRPNVSSKQRAMNINAQIAPRLLSPEIHRRGTSCQFDCQLIFGDHIQESKRPIGKVGKNWRLGGNKIEGKLFNSLDSKDFALIRSIEKNDSTHPVRILFVSRTTQRKEHARIVRLVEPTIKSSMAIYRDGSAGFSELANLFPDNTKKRRTKS
jgi:hypothetical protein